ncbi:MAG: AraC family transcriptional regulator [Prevotella sp.]|nr:AraC family transcriptional regulator [Prevotella sp.]
MITLQMMQFTAVVLMLLLTVKLLFLRERRIKSRHARQARWLMTTATALLSLHFAIQLKTGLRLMGITQSVMLNLAMLIPASHLFARAILLLQRRGNLSLADRWTGPAVWTVTMAMLAVAALTDGQPLLSDTLELRLAERTGAVLYMLMQGYYTWRHSVSLVAMHRALHDYYDRDTDGMLRWMQYSIVGLMLLALMVPVAIFSSGPGMLTVAFAIYFLMFYLVDSFCFYLTSPAPERIQAAEQNAAEVEEELKSLNNEKQTDAGTAYAAVLSPEVMSEVEQAVEAWKARGGYCQTGLLQPIAAQAIGISRYRLTTWLHQQGLKYTEWIAQLRVEEAKRIIAAHPDWSNDAVAQHCGFTDRTVLQRTFKRIEGITPQKYLEDLEANSPERNLN